MISKREKILGKAIKLSIIIPALVILAFFMLMLAGCGSDAAEKDNAGGMNSTGNTSAQTTYSPSEGQNIEGQGTEGSGNQETSEGEIGNQGNNHEGSPKKPEIDYNVIKPDESGKIMVVMFHNFVSEYKSGDKYYTTTFNDFRNLLSELYEKGYRLISLTDLLTNNIDVPAGTIPIVFTFDDGISGQFNLVETTVGSERVLKANPESAVGIMEEFYEQHPDFGLEGTFFVNLGTQTFKGSGTLAERLRYLIDRGFEIGNHTYSHINLKETRDAKKIQEEIAKNVIKMQELVPGYLLKTFSLPYGLPSEKSLWQYVIKGEYNGITYENIGILEVGWDPSPSPVSRKFDPMSIHRVRSTGIVDVEADLKWWLGKLKREEQYISDGDPGTVTVPESSLEKIDIGRLNGKKLVTY